MVEPTELKNMDPSKWDRLIFPNFSGWKSKLVGGWTNPSEKYARQIGSSPQVGMKIKNFGVATT